MPAPCAGSPIAPPPPVRPLGPATIAAEVAGELRNRRSLPPGFTTFSLTRTRRFQRDTLALLLEGYARFGPVFTLRLVHRPVVVMLGPEASHFVTVTGAEHFSWRRGMAGEQLSPLLGDGLITTDGAYHDRARALVMPAFHRRRMDAAVAVMIAETERAVASWSPGRPVELYGWSRRLAMDVAMRAIAGFDPHDGDRGGEATDAFEAALAYFDSEPWVMLLRGPGTPWARLQSARRRLDALVGTEIARRRSAERAGAPATADDALSMLLASGGAGDKPSLTDLELRDQLVTLLFGAHDTSASAASLLIWELVRHPDALAAVLAEQQRELDGAPPDAQALTNGLPGLDNALAETLRLYPPVWFGARRAVRDIEFAGHRIPAGAHVIHSPWATHRLPDVFPDPDRFEPERFTPAARAALPRGAYVPFGGGARICVGKRFGQLLAKAVASVVLARAELVPAPGHQLELAALGTLTPRGLPVTVRSLRAARETAAPGPPRRGEC